MSSDDLFSLESFLAATNVASEFNEYVPSERLKSPSAAPSHARGTRPGDEFNRRASWQEILEPHGWSVCRTSGAVTYWTRPDKNARHGCSATTGKCESDGSGDLLYVFSSNAPPFEPDTAYSKFGAFGLLNHAGDYGSAARALRSQGYGSTDPADGPALVLGRAQYGQVDDGVSPDYDFATNEDLRRLDLGTKWVWDRWLQLGAVNLMAAEGGLGKTRFMADLCRRVHQGLPWPDSMPGGKWDSDYIAMWVAGDRNQGELLTLSEDFGFGSRISYSGSKAEPLGGVSLNTPSEFAALYRKAKAARPLFLVVDTAGGSTGYDLGKQQEARSFFAPLSDIAVKLGLCVVVITHLNATKTVLGKRAEERVRVVLRVTAENREPGTTRRVEVVKSNGLFPAPIGMTLGSAGNDYDDNPPAAPEPFGTDRSGSSEDGPPTKTRECAEWLKSALEFMPRKVHELRNEAERAGFTAKVLYKAKATLNLIESETQGFKIWGLR